MSTSNMFAEKMKKLQAIDFFAPEKFLLFYLIFIGIAVVSFFSGLPIQKPGVLSFLVIFAAFPFFILGIKFGKYIHGRRAPKFLSAAYIIAVSLFYALVFSGFYKFNLYLSLILCITAFLLLYLAYVKIPLLFSFAARAPSILMLIGAAFLFLAFFRENGIPLLNPALKTNFLYSTEFGISMIAFIFGFSLLMPKIKDDKKFFIVLIGATLLFLLSALRGPILAIFLTGAFIAYYTKKIGNKKIFLVLIAALLIIFLVGYWARPILNPAELFLYRAGTTHAVFDKIVDKSMPFGYTHGTLFFKGSPRDFVGSEIMGKNANLTYTILGAAVLDFGLAGAVLWMFFLGAVLQLAYLNMHERGLEGFYPLLFSVSLVFIEIGVDQFFLLFFFAFLLFYLAKITGQRDL